MLRPGKQKHLDIFCQNIPAGPVFQPRIEKTFSFAPIYRFRRFQSCFQRRKIVFIQSGFNYKMCMCLLFHNCRKCCIVLRLSVEVSEQGVLSGNKRLLLSASGQSEISEDELSVINNHLSPATCKWQSSRGNFISRAPLTLHDSAQELVRPVNSKLL